MFFKNSLIRIFFFSIIGFSLIEFTLRIYDLITDKTIINVKNNISYFSNYKNHPFLIYTGRKNQSGYQIHLEPGKYFKTTTNSDGFRSREFYPRVDYKNLRIMILGDSFVWGYNVDDENTLGVNLEKELIKNLNRNIEVYSIGVPSYSVITYQGIAKTYFDLLKPDIIIIAIDQNDFEDDLIRKELFIKDEDGNPVYYKNFKEENDLLRFDGNYRDIKSKIKLTSVFIEKLNFLRHKIFDPIIHKYNIYRLSSDYEIIKYKNLNKDTKSNLYDFYNLHRDNICCNLENSIKKYQVSFNSLKFIKNKSDKIGAKLYLSTYPYAWYVDPTQSLEWQLKLYKGKYILDLGVITFIQT